MLAFKGDFKLKEKLLQQLKAHYEADEIVKGQYWENGKGSFVGCCTHVSKNPYVALEEEYNIPVLVGGLQDGIFESLSNEEAKNFVIPAIEAIPVGADLSEIFYKWSIKMLKRVRPFALDDGKAVIDYVIKLFENPKKITPTKAVRAARPLWAIGALAAGPWAARAAAWAAWAAQIGAARAEWAARAARAAAEAGAGTTNQKNDLIELFLEAGQIKGYKQASKILGVSEGFLIKELCGSKYEVLKKNKKKEGKSVIFNIEDLLRVKLEGEK